MMLIFELLDKSANKIRYQNETDILHFLDCHNLFSLLLYWFKAYVIEEVIVSQHFNDMCDFQFFNIIRSIESHHAAYYHITNFKFPARFKFPNFQNLAKNLKLPNFYTKIFHFLKSSLIYTENWCLSNIGKLVMYIICTNILN